jgi:hypothetical protein
MTKEKELKNEARKIKRKRGNFTNPTQIYTLFADTSQRSKTFTLVYQSLIYFHFPPFR